MTDLSVVGKSVTRVDAFEKVTGRAKFTSEEGIGLPGMLYGKVFYSPIAHGLIQNIDTSTAKRVTGVKAILTGKDAPDFRSGVMLNDRHVLCRERVRFVGDAVGIVVASTEEAAAEAKDLIRVEYEVLPAIFNAEEAIKPDCPVVLHPELPNYTRPAYPHLGRDLPGPNVHTHHKIRKGNISDGFRQADLIVESRYENDRITHCQLEPYNTVAYPDNDGGVTIWTSGRVHTNQWPLAAAFQMSPTKLRIKAAYVGGMFGQVARPERFAILIALKTGRPVKIVYSREECFTDGLNRLPKVIYIRDGVKSDGTMTAREMRVIINSGAYTDHAPLTIRNGSFHSSQYRLPNFKWDAYGVYTNQPCVGPLRGFGSAECLWATEQQMDIIAQKLGLDPVELRHRNTVAEGEEDVRGETVHSIGAKECLDKVAAWIGWGKPCQKDPASHIKRGKGLALGNKYTIVDGVSSAVVKVHMDGTIEVRHGTDECGQGCNTVLTQIAAEEFGVTPEKIKIVWGDTGSVPFDFGAASSRSTFFVGNAVLLACRDAIRQLFQLAAPRLGTTPAKLATRDGRIFIKKAPDKSVRIAELFLPGNPAAKGLGKAARVLETGGELLGKATFWIKPSEEDPETGQGTKLTASTAYSAQAVEVVVDTETGTVRVLRICSASDMGKAIHPKMCEGQMEGGAAMGIGSALYEGFVFDNAGKLLNSNFVDYRIPSFMEVPSGEDNKSILVEEPHRDGPFGAKGVGEVTMCPTAPAIANAIFNATGVRIYHLPMTPENLLQALKKRIDNLA